MILIADCGATKADWCLIDGKKAVGSLKTAGYNAATTPPSALASIIERELLPHLPRQPRVSALYFYGAGCIEPFAEGVRLTLRQFFPEAETDVQADLMAAARALCGTRPGIVCILGTGSATGFYDGERIVDQVPSLGYILGDEGSGAALGRRLIADVFKGQLPPDIAGKFLEQYGLRLPEVIENVYRKPAANRYLASFAPFLLDNIEHPDVRRLVAGSFNDFFCRNIRHYERYGTRAVNIVGSIGWHFRHELARSAAATGFTLGRVLKAPLPALIDRLLF